jgi:predicted RecB family nuclease
MKIAGEQTFLSATDLSTHFGCRHATKLNILRAKGELKQPFFDDPSLEALRKKGEEFEAQCLLNFEAEGKSIVQIEKGNSLSAFEETKKAMEAGIDIIYQARLEHEIWLGWADFLIKVNKPSSLGDWSYEVVDTKLSNTTKASSILQICLYSKLLEYVQGVLPDRMYIRNPNGEEIFRVNDYMAYFRLIRKHLLTSIVNREEQTYPEPVSLCEMCDWWTLCNERRRNDDHLCFVAGMGNLQVREVKTHGVDSLASMAALTNPVPFKPSRGSRDTFNRLREQARIQLESREQKKCLCETLPLAEGFGFYRLPEPDAGDIFFDFEGDPFVGTAGREYLFGWVYNNNYESIWANTEAEEKEAFENFIDQVMQIWKEHPGMHIYHYSPYEPAALKRLMGRFATRENEVDMLLRAGIFIDLHSVVKQSIRAGVESYSLKELEKLHGFLREVDLRTVVQHKVLFECLLEAGNYDAADETTINIIREYNKDDCLSTLSLRDWLEELRSTEIKKGNKIPRPESRPAEPNERISDHQQRIRPLFDALMNGLPLEKAERDEEQQAKWLLAHMLDWYRREEKSFWWNFFRLRELTDEELLDEREAISGLLYLNKRQPVAKSYIDFYSFPVQETELKIKDTVGSKDNKIGEIVYLDFEKNEIGLKKRKDALDIHPTQIMCSDHIKQHVKEEAIIRLAEWVIKNGIDASGAFRAGRDLLLRKEPRTNGKVTDNQTASEKAVAWVSKLDHSVLPIQGPPGTGKSHTGAQMVLELIKQGKKIGITAMSHKVITGLLEKIQKEAIDRKVNVRIVQKVTEASASPKWEEVSDNGEALDEIQNDANILAGTSFMWAREEFSEAVDVLFVDEAGQLSLIDTLALSHAGKNLVLLGDPQQLQQPQKGDHPEGTEVSALQHILQEHQTILPGQGVFLDKTWRMHSAICAYTSELFYEGKLESMPQNANQRLEGNKKWNEPGIYYEAVAHKGNRNSSIEEVERIKQIVDDLLQQGTFWNKSDGTKEKFTVDHIKIISPYNAQVNDLATALPGIQVGTVDKFQGQEAPVIIFSMATSSPEDAPRGMEFLYSLNRMNVAVSRARAVFILVANPDLFEPHCRSPYQMQLANALCRLREMAIDTKISDKG